MAQATPRHILHVDMDAFYASVEERDQPEYAGRAVIVGGLGPRGVVAAANYAARRHGVHSAMPMARARVLCRNSHDAVFLAPRMHRYREVSEQIFAVFLEFTPLVEGLSLDEAFLDVTGSIRLFGSVRRIGSALRDTVRERTGLVASIGMAGNKFLAKLASEAGKPAGFVEVRPGEEQDFIGPMPVGRIWGIGRKTESALRRMGILTVGQLRRTDAAVLEQALGNRTGHFLALARGEDERAVTPGREEKSISHEVTFDANLLDSRAMHAELQGLAEAVTRRLRAHGLCARTVQLKIREGSFQATTRRRTMRAPTSRTDTVFTVVRGLLDTWLSDNANTPVRLLGVGLSGLEPGDPGDAPLDSALDRIARRFGGDTITHALALERGRKTRR